MGRFIDPYMTQLPTLSLMLKQQGILMSAHDLGAELEGAEEGKYLNCTLARDVV